MHQNSSMQDQATHKIEDITKHYKRKPITKIMKTNINPFKLSFAPHACPRCNSRDTRQSKRSNGSLFDKLLKKSQRCNSCYFRFRVMSPFRMLVNTLKFFNS